MSAHADKEKGTFEFARTAVSYADINRRFKR
jgi:hypothetical protein